MDKNKKYQILKYVLIVLFLTFAFFLWRSVDRAIFVDEASVWKAPINWASLFFITLALAIFLIREKSVLYLSILAALASSLFFSPAPLFALVVALAFLLAVLASDRMRDDFRSRLRIDLGKNIRSGSAFIIFSLGIMIAGQYYFQTRDLAAEKYLPRFELDDGTNGYFLKLVGRFVPQAKDLTDDHLTVDQFLAGLYSKQSSGVVPMPDQLKNLTPEQRKMIEGAADDVQKNMALSEGKKQLSKLALRDVKGDEKIRDVFSDVINSKITSYFVPNLGERENSPLFSAIIAIVIFLTVTSLGSFLIILWIPITKIIFFIFKKTGAVSVAMVPAEKEIVE